MALLLGLIPIALQLLLVIHVIKTGRSFYWIYLLVFLPLVGGLAYLIVEVLPDVGRSRALRSAGSAAGRLINPTRRLRELESLVRVQDTVRNKQELAEEYLACGMHAAAAELLSSCRTGIYANDPDIRRRLACALLEGAKAEQAREILDGLAAQGGLQSLSDRLLHLRAREATGTEELPAFRELYQADRGLEAGYWYVAALVRAGRTDEARAVVDDMREQLKRYRQFRRTMGKAWFEKAAKLAG